MNRTVRNKKHVKRSTSKRKNSKTRRRHHGGAKKTIKFKPRLTPIQELDEEKILMKEEEEEGKKKYYKGVEYSHDPNDTALRKLEKWLYQKEQMKKDSKEKREIEKQVQYKIKDWIRRTKEKEEKEKK